jgi:hypothetical protein
MNKAAPMPESQLSQVTFFVSPSNPAANQEALIFKHLRAELVPYSTFIYEWRGTEW